MNYKHSFHAGSFADCVKHIALIALINSLKNKETPFCYIDTHAGIGYYDLESEMALKTKEYQGGIEKIIAIENPPALIKQFLDCVHTINNELSHAKFASLRYYPGSPLIAKKLLRPKDRIIACELHPKEYQTLRQNFAGDKQVATHHLDGFLGLKAFLPPIEKRGLVLIDPPYEDPAEFTKIAQSLAIALKRWSNGVIGIWYPIKEKGPLLRFYRELKEKIAHPTFIMELSIYPELPNHLNGTGLAVINPPYKFDENIKNILPILWKALSINGQGDYRTFIQ